MKLHCLAIAAAAALAAPAFAAPAVNIDAASTVRIYLSGATALHNALFGVVLNDLCGGSAANASTTLYNVTEGTGGAPVYSNANSWAISCNLTASGAAKVGLATNTPVAFFKSGTGGSAQGVFPVYFQGERPFAQPTACTTTAIADRAYTGCPTTRNAVPTFGLSDVEPGMFKGFNVPNDPIDADDDAYPPDGLTPEQIGELTVTPVVQTVFAMTVNQNLYNAMFAKQGLAAKKDAGGAACVATSADENCVPSMGYAEARTLLQGTESNWRLLVNASDPLVNSQVNVCRRVQGSGTQASANSHLMAFPCGSSPLTPADYSYSSSAAPDAVSSLTNTTAGGLTIANYLIANMGGGTGTGPMPSNSLFVFEGPGTGDVRACLTAANKAGGYAIGHVSRENNEEATWKFVKLEGAYPSRDNLKQGRYDYAVESTLQYNNAAFAGLTASQRAFVTGFTAEIAKPAALARLASANQNGVAALPASYAGAFGSGSAAEITFGSRVTRAGNTCTPLTAVK